MFSFNVNAHQLDRAGGTQVSRQDGVEISDGGDLLILINRYV